jgi:transposase
MADKRHDRVHEGQIMDTKATDKLIQRRNYSAEFKAQVVAQCNEPGASVAKVAMSHGINDNLVHGWRKLAREAAICPAMSSPAPAVAAAVAPAVVVAHAHRPQFLAVPLPARLPTPSAAATPAAEVELRRGTVAVKITWPAATAVELAALVRDLLRA